MPNSEVPRRSASKSVEKAIPNLMVIERVRLTLMLPFSGVVASKPIEKGMLKACNCFDQLSKARRLNHAFQPHANRAVTGS